MLLIGAEESLHEEIALLAAVAGVRLHTAPSWGEAPDGDWAAVLCTPQALPPTAAQAEGVLLVGDEPSALWEAAAAQPGLVPVPLPQAERWLSEVLVSRVLDRAQGPVVAVASTGGGAGATTVAYLCAAELAVRGQRPALLDACPGPGSGALELVTGAHRSELEGEHGMPEGRLDWERLLATEGEISAKHLANALPGADGVAVLTGSADPQHCRRLLPAVLRAARRAFDAVIVDVGTRAEIITALPEPAERTILVARASPRAAAAAKRLRELLPHSAAVLALNRTAAAGWGPEEMQQAVGLPVTAELAEQRWLARSDHVGEAYHLLRSRRGARIVAGLLQGLHIEPPEGWDG